MKLLFLSVDIGSIFNAADNSTDDAMVTYQSNLRAMPNEEPYSQRKFLDQWNDSAEQNDNRPKIGRNDDILLADSIFSELEKYQKNDHSNVPFFTKFYTKFKCTFCETKHIVKNYAKAYKVIPLLTPKTTSRKADRVSASVLLTDFMNEKVPVKCPTCDVENDAKLHPVQGKFTCLAINRRDYTDKDGVNVPKFLTKVTDVCSAHLWGDPFVKELVFVVAHKGTIHSGHWICYSKVEEGAWYVNSDKARVKQTTHPLRHNKKDETADLLIFKNF